MENKKQCFKCKNIKTLSDFYKHQQMPDGHVNKCKECNKKDVKLNYRENILKKKEYEIKRTRYNFQRIFLNRWFHIKHRCDGKYKQSLRYSKYNYLSKEDFMSWCLEKKNLDNFIKIWIVWAKSNFQRNLTPSIDRIDTKKGYLIDNIQWLSLKDNILKYTNTLK